MSAASKAQESLSSTISYSRQLVGSGIEGASTAVHRALRDESARDMLRRAVRSSCRAGVATACLAIAVSAVRKRSAGTALVNGLAGGAIVFSAWMIWSSHDVTAAAGRGAVAGVNAARDAHWLQRHPIDYA
jgi:hypothetical protein